MAYEMPGFSWTLVSGEDLSHSQFCAVDVGRGGDAGLAVLPDAGGRVVGVLQNKPGEGQSCTIVSDGITKVKVGVTGVEAGDTVTCDDDGTIIQAASGDASFGVALETNAEGELGTVLLLLSPSTVAGS